VYFFPTRDAGALVDPAAGEVTPELMAERHRGLIRKLADGRLYLPAAEPYLEGHNTRTPSTCSAGMAGHGSAEAWGGADR
jgi:hypothetical protein